MARKNYVVETVGNWFSIDGGTNNFKGTEGVVGYFDTEADAIVAAKAAKDSTCEVLVTFTRSGEDGLENEIVYETCGEVSKAEFVLCVLGAVTRGGTGTAENEVEQIEDGLEKEITRPIIGVERVTEKGFTLAKEVHANHFPNFALTRDEHGNTRWLDTAQPGAELLLKHRTVLIPAVDPGWSRPRAHDKVEAPIIRLLTELIHDRNANRALLCLQSALIDTGVIISEPLISYNPDSDSYETRFWA